jgi:uncharacterized protein
VKFAEIPWQTILATKPFRPKPGTSGPHRQTLLAYFWPRRYFFDEKMIEQRLFTVEDGSQLLAECHWQSDREAHPTLVIVHGLEGSSRSGYALGTADKAFRAGFNAVRLNIRNCGGTEHLTPTLYHSGQSDDLRQVVGQLVRDFALQRIYIAGFSLGGNICLKLAGEWGSEAPPEVQGFIGVCPVIDLMASWPYLEKPSAFIYRWQFVWSLRQRIRRKIRLFPGRYDPSRLCGIRTIREFDSRYTAPYMGFLDVYDYYTRASAAPVLSKIRVPTLIIHAADDPLLPPEPFVRQDVLANPFIVQWITSQGGHVGFLGSPLDGDPDDRWAENRLIQFLQLLESSA